MSERLAGLLVDLLARGKPAVLMTVARARGSTPREAGARMVVTHENAYGTIGGGRVEWEALAAARKMLAGGAPKQSLELPLGPAVGQCCGGHVLIELENADRESLDHLRAWEKEQQRSSPTVMLFGAGHVGKALAAALAPLPFQVRWLDGRAEQFPEQSPDGVEIVCTERLLDEVAEAPEGSAYLVLTHSHALDFEICASVLERGDFAYLGLIGSATKRARFERGFRELGVPSSLIRRLVCPIGGTTRRDKRPAVIAALTAAELLLTLAHAPTAEEATAL